jgi:AcrR family transcriptional regulator
MMSMRSAGRPRAAGFDERVIASAQAVFADHGWAGFTFEAIARHAGIGKPAIYRRWSSRRDLLGAAAAQLPQPVVHDEGSLEADLFSLFQQFYGFSLGVAGTFWMRLELEVNSVPELGGFFQAGVLDASRLSFGTIAARAIARGELHDMPPVTFLMELAVGSINMRIAHSPAYRRAELEAGQERYARRLAQWMTIAITETDGSTSPEGMPPSAASI